MHKRTLMPLLFATATLTLVCCNGNKKPSGENEQIINEIFNEDTLSEAEASKPDTFVTEAFNLKKEKRYTKNEEADIIFDIKLIYPPKDKNDAMSNNVRKWISEQLSYCVTIEDAKPPRFKGDLTSPQNMVTFYWKGFRDQADAEIASELDSFAGEEIPPYATMHHYDFKITKEFECENYVCFSASSYIYLGGAHGTSSVDNATFVKPSGKQLTWDFIFPAKNRAKVGQIVKKHLLNDYFKPEGKSNNIDDYITLTPEDLRNGFPLPACNPSVNVTGISFVYNQYEIACYAAGMPSTTIPVSELKNLMTPEAKKFFEANSAN